MDSKSAFPVHCSNNCGRRRTPLTEPSCFTPGPHLSEDKCIQRSQLSWVCMKVCPHADRFSSLICFLASLQVSIIPVQGEISVGESKFFLCEVGGGAKGIDWFSPTGEKIEPYRQDVSAFRNDETSSTLTIYNANIENAGAYKCVATGWDQQAEATVNVKIYQKITFRNAPSPQEFTEKDNAVIVCDVASSPPPTVIWKHKRAKIQFDKDVRFKFLSNNHLQIRGIRKADEGEYTCEGLIMARGEIDFRTIFVVVNVVPTIQVRQPEVNSTSDMGHTATLACDADGFPKPVVSWTRNNALESGDKYRFSEDGSEMTIMDVKKLDEGDYTCVARNKAGKSEEEVSLRVFVKPTITYLENRTTTETEERVTLTCEATGDPTPSITWSFGSRVFNEGEQVSVLLLPCTEHLKRIYQVCDQSGRYVAVLILILILACHAVVTNHATNRAPGTKSKKQTAESYAALSASAVVKPVVGSIYVRLVSCICSKRRRNEGAGHKRRVAVLQLFYFCSAVSLACVGTIATPPWLAEGLLSRSLGRRQRLAQPVELIHSDNGTRCPGPGSETRRLPHARGIGSEALHHAWAELFGQHFQQIRFTRVQFCVEVIRAVPGVSRFLRRASWTRPEQHKVSLPSPQVLDRSLDTESKSDTHSTLSFPCGVDVWHRSEDGSVVVRSDARLSALTLKYPQHTDAGRYLCTARNAVGETSRHMTLEVQYAPKILGSVAVYTWEGNAANISCEILAHPSEVSIVWLRDGLQLPHANASNVKIHNTPSASYLEVNPDSQNDFGSYNCTVSNEIGTESKEFILIQADVPSAPTISQVEPYSSTAVLSFAEPEAMGGVPVLKYRVEWRAASRSNWAQRVYEVREGGLSAVTITGLKPETSYEVKMSAVNGKGQGESSPSVAFKTEPVREPSPPKLVGTLQPKGNILKVNWLKQDDGGSPITHYLIRYKARDDPDWKPEVRLPGWSEHTLLSGLDWDTEYDVLVVAENQRGKSQPTTLAFRTALEPAANPALVSPPALACAGLRPGAALISHAPHSVSSPPRGALCSARARDGLDVFEEEGDGRRSGEHGSVDSVEGGVGLNTGLIVGILVLVCALLLLAVDAACCVLNKCGVLMCICGKAGASTKGKDVEACKAAYVKDNSKEPIVEMRTEDQFTANHDIGGHPEPNETTPLTEAERLADGAAAVVDLPLSVATNSDTVTDTFDLSQGSPVSESTTLTSSLVVPPPDPYPIPASGPDTSTPKTISQPLAASLLISDTPLVDLADPQPTQTNGHPSIPLDPPSVLLLPQETTPKGPEKEAVLASFLESPDARTSLPPILHDTADPEPSVNCGLQEDGGAPQASETDLTQDELRALAAADPGGPSAPPIE
ncbi:hypothetical protein P4O66_017630 [Electrophorus voltai]|uniref:Neural cell adhesion molecule 1b n=1 Tax=Electrophorus voltai TaxID=2609070 RepID=A0AAD8YVL7_9TELE|nr:hypothetical protein P4O66_017630 [Electrophorus voltai]